VTMMIYNKLRISQMVSQVSYEYLGRISVSKFRESVALSKSKVKITQVTSKCRIKNERMNRPK